MTTAPHANRFDFLRLFLACIVIAFHLVTLPELPVDREIVRIIGQAGELAIQSFFVISGALVLGSITRSKFLGSYADKRIRRVYPAYIVVIGITALIGLILSGQLSGVLKYLGANLLFLNFLAPTLPGLFEDHAHQAVNGSLWTIKIEVMFYIALPVIYWVMQKLGRAQWGLLLAFVIGAEIWRIIVPEMASAYPTFEPYGPELARQLPGQMGYFAAGMAMWLLWDKAKQAPLWFVGMGTVLVTLSFLAPGEVIWRAPGLALLIAWTAFASGPALNAARYGDLSYGVYIIHFPMIQGLIALGAFAVHPLLGVALTLVLTFGLSFALWHLIEKRFLRRGNYYRRADITTSSKENVTS